MGGTATKGDPASAPADPTTSGASHPTGGTAAGGESSQRPKEPGVPSSSQPPAPTGTKEEPTADVTDLLGGDDAGQETGEKTTETGQGAPAEYSAFELPEGVERDERMQTWFAGEAAKLGLSQEQAQGLVTSYAGAIEQAAAAQAQAWTEHQEALLQEVRNDPDIGGQRLPETERLVGRAINRMGWTPLRKVFRDYGVANHPEVVKALRQVGAMLSEDRVVNGQSMPARKSAAEVLYPDMTRS